MGSLQALISAGLAGTPGGDRKRRFGCCAYSGQRWGQVVLEGLRDGDFPGLSGDEGSASTFCRFKREVSGRSMVEVDDETDMGMLWQLVKRGGRFPASTLFQSQ